MARRKFQFVEMFIDPKTGGQYENINSPKVITPKHFPKFVGHQIAKIEYEEKEVIDIEYKGGKDGKITKGEEKKRKILIEKMGEKGGWIEQTTNLSQDGDCWVGEDGIVCGNGYVSGDVELSSGEVGDNAKVAGEAKISGSVGIGGNAYVYGKANIRGGGRIAVKGTARVEGKVEGNAVVEGNAYVGEEAVVKGNAHVKGNARIMSGTVEGDAEVKDCATVYGTVKGKAEVAYEAVILENGSVEGNAVIESGMIEGTVKGDVKLNYGQAYVAEGATVEGTGRLEGNAFVKCAVKGDAQIDANGSAFEGGSVSGGVVSGNGTVKGRAEKARVEDGAMVLGSAESSAIMLDGSRIGENGSLNGATTMDSANVGGTASSPVTGNSVVAPGASSSISLKGNMVYQEGDNQEPDGVAVVCKVEA